MQCEILQKRKKKHIWLKALSFWLDWTLNSLCAKGPTFIKGYVVDLGIVEASRWIYHLASYAQDFVHWFSDVYFLYKLY